MRTMTPAEMALASGDAVPAGQLPKERYPGDMSWWWGWGVRKSFDAAVARNLAMAPSLARIAQNDPSLLALDGDGALLPAALPTLTPLEQKAADEAKAQRERAAQLAAAASAAAVAMVFSNLAMGDPGAAAIGPALRSNLTLTSLDLSRNAIGPAGAKALAKGLAGAGAHLLLAGGKEAEEQQHHHHSRHATAAAPRKTAGGGAALTNLNLAHNNLGCDGVGWLCRYLKGNAGRHDSPPGCVLTALDLRANGIGDAGAGALGKWLRKTPTLTSLRLAANMATVPTGPGSKNPAVIAAAARGISPEGLAAIGAGLAALDGKGRPVSGQMRWLDLGPEVSAAGAKVGDKGGNGPATAIIRCLAGSPAAPLELPGGRVTSLDLSKSAMSNELTAWVLELPELRTVLLDRNALFRLPLGLHRLKKLERLGLAGNPLKTPPADIAARGTAAVLDWCKYEDAWRQGEAERKRAEQEEREREAAEDKRLAEEAAAEREAALQRQAEIARAKEAGVAAKKKEKADKEAAKKAKMEAKRQERLANEKAKEEAKVLKEQEMGLRLV